MKTEEQPVRVYDEFGRERLIDRKVWREQVLPDFIRSNWHNADALYNILREALGDGYESDIIKATEHLHKLDKKSARSTCLYGVTLLRLGKSKEAERVMRAYLSANGEDGYVLLNLAKVYSEGNEKLKAREILWRAIEVDPNVENALQWYGTIQHDEGGPSARTEGWRHISQLPNSWRVRLFLANDALEGGMIENAIAYYKEALSIAGDPPPADILQSITGNLGNHGYLREALALAEGHFSPKHHGLAVGNNLIKAHVDLGELDEGKRLLDSMYALGRTDYKNALDFWEAEISKARVAKKNAALNVDGPMPASMMAIARPLWLPNTLPVNHVFPSPARVGSVVAILGSTASFSGEAPPAISFSTSTTPGMISRALPLLLMQELFFKTSLRAKALVPWITGDAQGYVLGGNPWTDDYAAEIARRPDVGADCIVTIHLHAKSAPWKVDFRLIQASGECVYSGTSRFDIEDSALEPESVTSGILNALKEKAGAAGEDPPPSYVVPSGKTFFPYLMSLEGLLTLQWSQAAGAKSSLHSPRDIIDRILWLAADCPTNAIVRALLIKTVREIRKIDQEIAAEYENRIERLHQKSPLPQAVERAIMGMLDKPQDAGAN